MERNKNSPGRQGPRPGASLVDWRLAYAAIGWPTILVHPIRQDGRCWCGDPGCPAPGAHAITTPTLDPATIRRECDLHWPANLAMHLRGARLACIGANLRDYGPEPLESFEGWHGKLRAGIVAEGGRGGTLARFCAAPPPGLDFPAVLPLDLGIMVTCGDACALVPPSRHPAGGRWTWPEGMCPWTGTLHLFPRRLLSVPWARMVRSPVIPEFMRRTLHPERGVS